MSTAQQARPETHGSRTHTITPTPAYEPGPSAAALPPVGVLKLRGGPSRKARVVWSEETVDNEGMGRKTSKICCIYNKPRAFDESSSESGSSDDEHDHDYKLRQRAKAGSDKGKGKALTRKDGAGGVEEVSEPESESDGGAGDGRARPVRRPNRRKHRHQHEHVHGDGCGGHADKPNKYDAQPRGVAKEPPTT